MSVCGEWAFYNKATKELSRWFCGSSHCHRPECRNLFWSARVRLISALIKEYNLIRFFTLTLDRSNIPGVVDPWDYITYPWSKFRKRMSRRFTDFRFVAILEAHKNNDYPHIHGFTNVWMNQRDWVNMWKESEGGEIVWIEKVKDEKASSYVSKTLEVAKYVGKENLIKACKKRKGQRTLWRSKNTKAKFELQKSKDWCIVKDKVFNEDGQLTDYHAKKGVWSGRETQ